MAKEQLTHWLGVRLWREKNLYITLNRLELQRDSPPGVRVVFDGTYSIEMTHDQALDLRNKLSVFVGDKESGTLLRDTKWQTVFDSKGEFAGVLRDVDGEAALAKTVAHLTGKGGE